MSKPKPKASWGLYAVIAVFAFVITAAIIGNQPKYHASPFGLILASGVIAHLIAYGGIYLLVSCGVLDKGN